MKICVAITGASGVILGQRLLDNLKEHEVHLVISDAARRVIALELRKDRHLAATYKYDNKDIAAPISSSSYLIDAMAVVPCSLKTLAGIAHGYADNLILRAAENMLRFNRKLVLAP